MGMDETPWSICLINFLKFCGRVQKVFRPVSDRLFEFVSVSRYGSYRHWLSHTYEVWIHDFRKASITGARLFREVACLKSFFYSTVFLQILLLQLFPSISHLIRRRHFAIYLSLLTPSILSHSDFVKSLSTARKSLRGFRKFFRRSTMTRPWREWRYKILMKILFKFVSVSRYGSYRHWLSHTYEVWTHDFWKASITGARLFGEVACLKSFL